MEAKYVLGVDGGNTKTHYFLYDMGGKFVDSVKGGTCSHEALSDSYAGTCRELSARLTELFSRNKTRAEEIGYAVFGLAGADFDDQKRELSVIVSRLGFRNFLVENDGFLGLKAGSCSGCGICCINGTGTVTVGINDRGERLQIGGLGGVSTDRAGAGYFAERGVAVIYNMLFRCGEKTRLKDLFYREFDIHDDQEFVFRAIQVLKEKEGVFRLNKMMEEAEEAGDGPVKAILADSGKELAKTVSGCAARLHMEGEIEVVLAGSVWVKGKFETLNKTFLKSLAQTESRRYVFTKLKQPPVTGAVIWALEEFQKMRSGSYAEVRREEILHDEALIKIAY